MTSEDIDKIRDLLISFEGLTPEPVQRGMKWLFEECLSREQEIDKLKAIIAVHNLCHDLHGKVGREEFEEGCRLETIKEFGSCGWAQELARLRAEKGKESQD